MIERVDRWSRRLRPAVTLRAALDDPQLLGGVLKGKSWQAWKVLLIASMGEALTDDERPLFTTLTGRAREPLQRVEEFAGIIGRRGGKSRAISVLATYIAGLIDHSSVLVPGERGVVLIVAPDQVQADVTLGYIDANVRNSPVLAQLIKSRTARTLRLTNGVDVVVRAADFRALRGITLCAAIADEVAFFLSDNSSNPDSEILNAIRPSLATTNGPLFLISSPYARRGELWRTYQRHFGAAGDPLIMVAQGASRTLNPSLPQAVVDRAMERDEASASAEYLAQFRRDIEAFVNIEAVNACIARGVFERAPQNGITYSAFVDPSGGSQDSMTLCIGHTDFVRQTIVLDALREQRPPFSPEACVEAFAKTLSSYRISQVTGDRYGGQWPVEQFSKVGISYLPADKSKSELYVDLLPLINSNRVELLDHGKLVSQLTGLERRTTRGGRDLIDHSPGSHDDVANVVAGIAALASRFNGFDPSFAWAEGADGDDLAAQAARDERRERISRLMKGHVDDDTSQAHPTLDNESLRRIAQPVGLGVMKT